MERALVLFLFEREMKGIYREDRKVSVLWITKGETNEKVHLYSMWEQRA